VGAHGELVTPLDEERTRPDLEAVFDEGFRSVAIVLMHGYRYNAHELLIAQMARKIGFTQVSTSHEASPMMKLVSRGDITYVEQVASEMSGVNLQFMQSSGGLTDAHRFQGKDAILSGPAGGIVGMARTGQLAGFDMIIGFDMGGTSTDVSHFAGEFEREFETQVAGVRLRAPMMSIHTVAAGGGSILHFDGARAKMAQWEWTDKPRKRMHRIRRETSNRCIAAQNAERISPSAISVGISSMSANTLSNNARTCALRSSDGRGLGAKSAARWSWSNASS
jgi:5-oxoprolinase (ATP-hydrolysing)